MKVGGGPASSQSLNKGGELASVVSHYITTKRQILCDLIKKRNKKNAKTHKTTIRLYGKFSKRNNFVDDFTFFISAAIIRLEFLHLRHLPDTLHVEATGLGGKDLSYPFFYLDAAWLNEGRCPGGRSSVSKHKG